MYWVNRVNSALAWQLQRKRHNRLLRRTNALIYGSLAHAHIWCRYDTVADWMEEERMEAIFWRSRKK